MQCLHPAVIADALVHASRRAISASTYGHLGEAKHAINCDEKTISASACRNNDWPRQGETARFVNNKTELVGIKFRYHYIFGAQREFCNLKPKVSMQTELLFQLIFQACMALVMSSRLNEFVCVAEWQPRWHRQKGLRRRHFGNSSWRELDDVLVDYMNVCTIHAHVHGLVLQIWMFVRGVDISVLVCTNGQRNKPWHISRVHISLYIPFEWRIETEKTKPLCADAMSLSDLRRNNKQSLIIVLTAQKGRNEKYANERRMRAYTSNISTECCTAPLCNRHTKTLSRLYSIHFHTQVIINIFVAWQILVEERARLSASFHRFFSVFFSRRSCFRVLALAFLALSFNFPPAKRHQRRLTATLRAEIAYTTSIMFV